MRGSHYIGDAEAFSIARGARRGDLDVLSESCD